MIRNIFEGSEFLLYDINDNPIALSKNCALKLKQNLVDITTKDSDGWKENLTSIKDWSIEFDGLISYDDDKFNTAYFLSQFENSEPFFIQFGVIQNGFTHTFWGEVALESIDLNADSGEVASYSGSLKGLGQLGFTNQGTPTQSGYLKTETDPVFRGSASFNITETNKNDWFEAYNKTLTEVGFSTVGNKTTLNVKLRDGSVYSTFFNQSGTGSGNVDLSGYYTSIQSDSKFQPLGNYVGSQYLSDYYYDKTEADSRYLISVDWSIIGNKPALFSGNYNDLFNKPLIPINVSQLVNDAGYVNASIINGLASIFFVENGLNTKANVADVYNKATADSKFHPLENQRLSTGNNVVFNKIKAVNELLIPAASSSTNQSIWLGEAGSAGNIPAPNITTLASLQDVSFSNLANGQSLQYDSNTGKWKNVNFQVAGDYVLQSQLFNYYTKTQTDGKFKDIDWLPTWNQVNSKPTNLSQFINDLGNYGGFLLSDGATYAGFAGNNVDVPYMRHTTSNSIVYLARKAELGALAYENKVYKHYSIDNQHYYIKHSWDGTGWNLRTENDVADEQPNIHLVNINGKSENSTAWNGQRYSSSELTTSSTWFLGYDAYTGEWKPTGKNVINSFLGLGSAAFKDENSWLKPSNHPNTASNYNFSIGTDGTRNFIQSHSGLELQINPLGNKVVLNNATVLNDLVIPATPSGANQSIWLGAAGSNSNNPSGYITTLASLQDVSFNNLQNGQSISYDASTGKWKNTTYQAAGNYALNDGSNIITTSFRVNLGLGSLAYRSEVPRADVVSWSLAQRNSAGDLYARYYNMQAGSPDEVPIANFVYTDGEGFLRKSSAGALSGWLGLNVGGSFHRFNTFYADANTVPEHTSNFTYQLNAPHNGYLGHFGAQGYGLQLNGQYGDGRKLSMRLRNGDAAAWNPWFQIYHSGDTTQVKSDLGLGSLAYRSGIAGVEVDTHINNTPYDIGVAKMLRWRNYADGHAIFDASAGLSPSGAVISNVNAQQAWTPTYPTLMGWNGTYSYGVRVDSARIADRSYIANQLASYNGSNTIYWGWDGNNINFKIDNSNFGSTIPVNISGSALSATRWGGAVYTGSEVGAIQHFMIGYSETDGTYHPANVNAVRNWLGLGSAAYINATATHNAANTVVQRDSNGYLGGENIFVGYAGKYLSTMFTEETLDLVASRNNNLYRPLHIRDGNHLQIWNNAAPYFGARWDMRNETVHQYVTRNSDGAAVAWKENWWDGANYHSLSVQPTGFLSSSRWRIGGGTGKGYDQAPLELLGDQSLPPRLGLHMQGVVASSISIGMDGAIEMLNNPGTGYEQVRAKDFRASERVIAGIDVQGAYTYGTTFVNGGRIWSGYDSGLAGAISCNNWFRSAGDTGWYNSTYQGGIYMIDSSWVRVYGGKNFLVEAQIRGNEFNAVGGNYNVGNYGYGLVGVYEPTRYQGVFSMGGAYTPAGDGTNLANSYGIVWTHANIGGQSKVGLGHQMLITEAGVTQTAIGNGIWTRANIYAAGQVEAPAMKATDRMIIPTIEPVAPVSGCIWIS